MKKILLTPLMVILLANTTIYAQGSHTISKDTQMLFGTHKVKAVKMHTHELEETKGKMMPPHLFEWNNSWHTLSIFYWALR